LGVLILGWSILKWPFVPRVLGAVAAILGAAAIAVTMLMPDHLSLYMPIFHLWPLWLAGTGIAVLRTGIRTESGVRS
jgi:peptidoglycan/LPS O-acetylase OafA/YrhL